MSDTFDHEADSWDSLLFSDDDDGMPVYTRKKIQCNKCKKNVPMRWQQHPSGKWWLVEHNPITRRQEWHKCEHPIPRYRNT